jgi:hypothetical protein
MNSQRDETVKLILNHQRFAVANALQERLQRYEDSHGSAGIYHLQMVPSEIRGIIDALRYSDG